MWVALFIGNGMLMCLYSMEWYARRRCPVNSVCDFLFQFIIIIIIITYRATNLFAVRFILIVIFLTRTQLLYANIINVY